MKTILIAGIIIILMAFATKDELTGRWETKPSVKGNITGVVFKPDSSFEGYINKKPFTSGKYNLQDSIISITENGCEGKKGVYKIILFSNADSMRWEPIMDSCNERREGITRLVFGKVK